MMLTLVLFLHSVPLSPHPSSLPPRPPSLSAEMSLGDSLLKHGFFSEATREFRRLLWLSDSASSPVLSPPSSPLSPSSSLIPLAHLKLGLSLAATSELPAAAEEMQAAGRINPELSEPAQSAMAGFYANARRYDLAAFELSDLLVFTRDSARRASLQSAIGWLQLREGALASAAQSYDLAGLHDVATALRASSEGPQRSPTLAAIMSTFVPGSGEAYAGRPANGLLALAVTAGSLVWTVAAARSDDWVSASVIFGAVFWRFYNGSRANAITFADDHNSASRLRRIARLSAELSEPDWFSGTDSLLGFRVRPTEAKLE